MDSQGATVANVVGVVSNLLLEDRRETYKVKDILVDIVLLKILHHQSKDILDTGWRYIIIPKPYSKMFSTLDDVISKQELNVFSTPVDIILDRTNVLVDTRCFRG